MYALGLWTDAHYDNGEPLIEVIRKLKIAYKYSRPSSKDAGNRLMEPRSASSRESDARLDTMVQSAVANGKHGAAGASPEAVYSRVGPRLCENALIRTQFFCSIDQRRVNRAGQARDRSQAHTDGESQRQR